MMIMGLMDLGKGRYEGFEHGCDGELAGSCKRSPLKMSKPCNGLDFTRCKTQKHIPAGIPTWSPTAALIGRLVG